MKKLTLVALAILLAACGGKDVTSGVVISRNYEASFTTYTQQCIVYDPKTFACTASMLTPVTYPDEWTLCLRDDSEDKPPAQQSEGCVSVSQADYERYSVGSHYPEATNR